MKYKTIKIVIVSLLTIITLISISLFNIYISIYYRSSSHVAPYNIDPNFLFGIILIMVIIHLICTFNFYKNK